MAYYLEKFIITIDDKGKEAKTPVSAKERADFVTAYNHQRGLRIEETDDYLFALEDNEYLENGEVLVNENYAEEQAELAKKKELERIANLKITKRVFALALRDNFGIPYQKLKQEIAQSDDALLEWDLCVELHRNNPLLDIMAAKMGVTSQQLDYIFRVANGEDVTLQVENEEESNTNETVLPEDTTEEELQQ